MDSDFTDKVVVITGASSGIGEVAALMFAKRNARVTLSGRDQGRLQAALEKCVEAGGGHADRYLTVQGDVSDPLVRQAIIQRTLDTFGQLDILVPNAGIILEEGGLTNPTEAAYDKTMDVNVKSIFFLIQESIPHLEKTKGCIVNVSSIGALVPFPDEIIYGMSKAALDYMTRTLALGLAPKGIRVNSINPTLTTSRIYRTYTSDPAGTASFMTNYASLHPLHQRESTPEEQASVIVFLASQSASFITGQCIAVDGGITLRGAST
ncbi:uncharacterized oxidoreductase TM_0325-like [Physella acuta]|uniref:uncharacterized oxidoreductase TM_0325-like n=1 Tax=Physella acuta TaxID=109671 RepID=UPI0027DE071C|nr:uncharacterized oxidoreductase TM_0325-like [Physella acuta]XP_059162067.1 uncharacterized oxidoreductase TM_0325-like [Physella acuta]